MQNSGGLKSVAPTAPTAAKPGGVKRRAVSRLSLGRSGESAMGPSRGPETCRGAAFCSHRVQRSVDHSLGRSGDEAVAGLRRGLDMSQASAAGAPLLARWLSADDDELLRSSGRAAPPRGDDSARGDATGDGELPPFAAAMQFDAAPFSRPLAAGLLEGRLLAALAAPLAELAAPLATVCPFCSLTGEAPPAATTRGTTG